MNLQNFMNVQETMDFLRLKRSTIYSYTNRGKIPYTKNGSRLYFKKADLEAYLNSKSQYFPTV